MTDRPMTIAQILAQLEPWDQPDEDDPPFAPCGCPLAHGPDTMHKFGCSWRRHGLILRVVAVREVQS